MPAIATANQAPASGPGLRGLLIDLALPWLTLQVLERAGVPTVWALAAAAVFPALALLSTWRRTRSLDVVAAIVVVSLGLGLLVALWAGDACFALVKAAPAFALFGAACLATLSARRPLMFFVARHFAPGDAMAKITDWEQRLTRPSFRDAMRRLTLVWGSACLSEAALGIAAAFLLPVGIAAAVEPTLAIATVALLLAWTRRFVSNRARGQIAQSIGGRSTRTVSG